MYKESHPIAKIENEDYKKNIFSQKSIYFNQQILINGFYYYKKYIKKLLYYKKFFVFFSFFLSYFLYLLSLEKCIKGFDICSVNLYWIKTKVIEEIISLLIMSILIELIIYKIISILHLIHIIVVFIIFYIYSHGLDFDDHGYFNFIFYFGLLIFILLFFLPFNGLIYFIKMKKLLLILIYAFILVILFVIIILYFSFFSECEDWSKGLNNTYINNNISCKININTVCPYNFFKKFQDFTKMRGINCKNVQIKNAKQNLLKLSKSPYINNKVNQIGYPLTNKDEICFLDYIDNKNLIRKFFLEHLVDMNNKTILNKYYKNKMPEIKVDFSNNNEGEMIINVNYNKTLSKERLLMEKKTNPYSNNLIILYIDSVSRVNSLRQLKNTTKFFERFMSYKGHCHEKHPEENFHSFQFFKYHSFLYHTRDNYPLIFYGEPRNKNIVSITKYYKENGYITGYSGDYCDKDNVRTFHNLTEEEIH